VFRGRNFVTGLGGIPVEMPDRTSGSPLLPLSAKEKDTRMKEERDAKLKDEFHKLLNGNHVDPTDRVT
jgi:sphingomyelin synthase-related protein 1